MNPMSTGDLGVISIAPSCRTKRNCVGEEITFNLQLISESSNLTIFSYGTLAARSN